MNSEDALYGKIKNGVLTLSGNNASIRVDGGYLVVSDGPWPVAPDHVGPAAPIEQRMVTHRFRRADCIVITRPDGFITFAAIKWLHGVAVSLVQLDWDGTCFSPAARPASISQPCVAPRPWPPQTASVTPSRKSSCAPSSTGRLPSLVCSAVAR